jgi:hypothetical protein
VEWTILWGGDGPEDVTFVTEGVVTVSDLDDMVQEALAAPQFRPGMKVLLDHRRADWSQMLSQDIHRRAALIRRDADRIGEQRIAFVASTQIGFGLGRMIEAFVNTFVGYDSRVFNSIDEARAWLAE